MGVSHLIISNMACNIMFCSAHYTKMHGHTRNRVVSFSASDASECGIGCIW